MNTIRHTLGGISNIVAIRLSGIGDVVLLLPALSLLKRSFDESRLTLITGSQCAPLARLCPYIDQIVPVDREALKQKPVLKSMLEIGRLIRAIRDSRFDLVVDFHGLHETSLLAGLSRAPYRMGLRRSGRGYLSFCFNLDPATQDETLHIRDMFRAVALNVPGTQHGLEMPRPTIETAAQARALASRLPGSGGRIVLYVGASRAPRRWPASRFAAVAAHAAGQLETSVLVLGGAAGDEKSLAHAVVDKAGHPDRVHLVNGLSFPEVVAVIESADLLVSNDTGPMHVGPALGIPTIGIFSGGSPHHYGPTGPLDRCIEGPSMEAIEADAVIQALQEVWNRVASRQR